MSLHMDAVLPEPSLLAYTKYYVDDGTDFTLDEYHIWIHQNGHLKEAFGHIIRLVLKSLVLAKIFT